MADDFVSHEPCPECGSSDALGRYSDGHGWCFACERWFPSDGDAPREGEGRRLVTKKELLRRGECIALAKRRITRETAEKFGYFVTELGGEKVQVAEYRDHNEQIIAQHIRTPAKEFSWRGHSKDIQLWGQHLWRDKGKMVVITEGEIDCMTVSQLQGNKWPVVSVPNGAQSAAKCIRKNLEWLLGFETVIIMFDMDEPGRDAAQECALLFPPGRVKVASLPLKDPNELLKAGRGAEVIDAVWGAKAFRPDGIISGQELWNVIQSEPTPGLELSYPRLQELLFGLRKRELVICTAGSGIGKSTLVNELGYDLLMRHGKAIGVIALEEGVKRSGERYMGIYLDRPIHISRDGVPTEKLREAFEATVGNGRFWLYDHFGSTNIDNLMAKIRFLAVGCGVDFVVLDHISIVVSGLDEAEESERKTIDRLMTRLRSLIEETGVGVIAIVHLKRPEKGKSYNEGRTVNLTDLRGSGSLEQIADIVIALERDQHGEEPDVAKLKVLKNRPIGRLGYADRLKYDHSTGRLLLHEGGGCPFGPTQGGGEKEDF